MTNEYENTQQLAYPGVYPNENEIIPYSPRREFQFMPSNKTITLDSMRDMSIDQIVELYKNGSRIETSTTSIMTATNDITVSSSAILLIGAGVLLYLMIRK